MERRAHGPRARSRLLLAGFALALAAGAQARTIADTVYVNGHIHTLDARAPVASSVAILDGRLIAVGPDAEGRGHVGPGTTVVDLGGATVVPGIIDSHLHLVAAGADVGKLDLSGAATVGEALAAIRAAVASKGAGAWIISRRWDPATQLAEKRALTAAEIDSVAPDNPVLLDGEAVALNATALRAARIDRATADPESGHIERDDAGNPTGLLRGAATRIAWKAVPPPTVGELEARYREAMRIANSQGLTSVVAAANGPDDMRALQALYRAGELTLRFSVILPPPADPAPGPWMAAVGGVGVASGFGDEWLRLDSLGELPVDGGMTFGTALTRAPYPQRPDYHGVAAIPVETLDAQVAIANRNGWRFTSHAIGDAAIDRLLDAYEAAGRERSIAGRRFVVLRGSLIQRDQLERMKRLGVILQIENMFMWDKAGAVERHMGGAVADRVFPDRMAIDILGIENVSQGSDFPTNSMNPWLNLYLAVTRRDETGKRYGADQAIGREEALRMYTLSGAHASFEDGLKGSIEVGKLADMVVLDRDYMTVDAEQIRHIRVLRTIVGGREVYRR